MATVPTPENAKPITDFIAGVFDGLSLLFQSRNGAPGKISGDDIANYVAVNKVYAGLGGKTIPQAIDAKAAAFVHLSDTLATGATTLTFTNASITSSSADIQVFTNPPTAYEMTLSNGEAELTFDAQTDDVNIDLWIW
jgi:hypothetical protein